MNIALKTLMVGGFFNCLAWIVLIPIWQYPDEQAHFAQVQELAELGKVPSLSFDTSAEIAISEKILGTERDGFGNNKFTYHPEYRIVYSDSFYGPQEQEITNLPRSSRSVMVKNEATHNPPLYYLLGSLVYKLFWQGSFFTRVYAVRALSVLIFLATIFTSYKIGKIIFEREIFALSLATVVAFKPMLVFASTGVLPDTLTNFLFSLVLLTALLLYKNGLSFKLSILLSMIIILGVFTRQQFLIAILIIVPLIIYLILKKSHKLFVTMSFPFGILAVIIFYLLNTFGTKLPFLDQFRIAEFPIFQLNLIFKAAFIDHIIWTIRHTYSEVLPWYWGVYRWLSLTLPPVIYQIINRIILIAFIGILLKVIVVVKKRKVQERDKLLLFMISSSLIYFLIFLIWDYFFRIGHGFSFGIQGRYFFPLIIFHLAIILVGIRQICLIFIRRYVNLVVLTVVAVFIFFNDYSLFFVASTYYDTSTFDIFIKQASQYKPLFFKGNVILAVLVFTILSQVLLVYVFGKYIIFNRNESSQRARS